MPVYEVETNRGTFDVELSRPPTSPAELQEAVRKALESMPTPGASGPAPGPATAPTDGGGGFLSDAAGMLRQAAGAVDPMGEMVTSGLRGETPQLEGAAAAARFAGIPATANPLAGGAVAAGGEMMAQGFEQSMGQREGFDPTAVGLAGMSPAIGQGLNRVAGAGYRAVAGMLPGAAAVRHEISAGELAKLADKFRNTPSSKELYAVLDQFEGIAMPSANLTKTARKLLDTEAIAAKGLRLEKVDTVASSLTKAAGPGSAMPFRQWRENLKRVGDWVRDTRDAGGTEHGAAKATFKAMMDDADEAIASANDAMPAAQALRAATAAAKREYVADEVAGLFNLKDPQAAVTQVLSGNDVAIKVNGAQVLKRLRTSEELQRSLPKAEYDQLLKDAEGFVKGLPGLPPPPGTNAGSFRALKQLGGTSAVGSGLGMVFGGPLGAAAGGMAGMGTAAILPPILGKLLVNEAGRKYLFGVLTSTGGLIDRQTAMLLATAATSTEPGRDAGATTLGPLFRQLFGGQ